MLIFTGMGEIRSFRYYAILFGSSINAFSIQGGILLANIFHAATALDQGCKFTSPKFHLGEGEVKVKAFHLTSPHLKSFETCFHPFSPFG